MFLSARVRARGAVEKKDRACPDQTPRSGASYLSSLGGAGRGSSLDPSRPVVAVVRGWRPGWETVQDGTTTHHLQGFDNVAAGTALQGRDACRLPDGGCPVVWWTRNRNWLCGLALILGGLVVRLSFDTVLMQVNRVFCNLKLPMKCRRWTTSRFDKLSLDSRDFLFEDRWCGLRNQVTNIKTLAGCPQLPQLLSKQADTPGSPRRGHSSNTAPENACRRARTAQANGLQCPP